MELTASRRDKKLFVISIAYPSAKRALARRGSSCSS
jgi:hypothetical protein